MTSVAVQNLESSHSRSMNILLEGLYTQQRVVHGGARLGTSVSRLVAVFFLDKPPAMPDEIRRNLGDTRWMRKTRRALPQHAADFVSKTRVAAQLWQGKTSPKFGDSLICIGPGCDQIRTRSWVDRYNKTITIVLDLLPILSCLHQRAASL